MSRIWGGKKTEKVQMTPSLGLSGWENGELFSGMGQPRVTEQVFITEDAKQELWAQA